VLVSGAAIRYEPSALVWHSHRRDRAALARQLRDDGRAFGVYLITCLQRRTVSRRVIAQFGAIVWLPSLAGRWIRSLLGRDALPPRFTAATIVGALQAPWAHWRTRRRDREMRSGDIQLVRAAKASESAPVGADSSAS
jgi:hypothetical protein